MLAYLLAFLLVSASIGNLANAQRATDPYVPTQTNCTSDVQVRSAEKVRFLLINESIQGASETKSEENH